MKEYTYKSALKEIGVSYIGNTRHSAKMQHSYNSGTETYCVYLAPADLSGRNVCPNSEHCKEFCLNGSGHNKLDILTHGVHDSIINKARIKKTQAFYKNRSLFIRTIIHEIKTAKKRASAHGREFSVRLNGTSDLSPVTFRYDGKNLLELFPDVQFYDYTKVPSRQNLLAKYPNYDITLSFDGYNWDACEAFLKRGGKVAVIFHGKTLPATYKGYKVVDANGYDMRYLDPKGCIMGLSYHPVANDYKSGKYIAPISPAIISENSEYSLYN